MEWAQVFSEKEDWQKNTFNRIKNDLICARDNRFVRYENTIDNHLVMVYGKSQVGKTTLILNMMGVQDAYIEKVYNTLRAGIPQGNSSTSTAIIYSKSINEKYGFSFTSLNKMGNDELIYCDPDELVERLSIIRREVEEQRLNSNTILSVQLPCSFFINDPSIDSISIMDMPGIESRNYQESLHAQNLMIRYLPVASVCMIVCRSNDIQSLETTVLPNKADWKRLEHRYLVVVTNSYNDGKIRQYFNVSPNERDRSFYEFVMETYTNEVRVVLGNACHLELYPLDVGNSLKRLCTEQLTELTDCEEVKETKNRIISELRRSIVSRKGEKLMLALRELKKMADHYGDDEANQIKLEIEQLHEKVNSRNKSIAKAEEYLAVLSENGSAKEVDVFMSELTEKKEQFESVLNSCVIDLSSRAKWYIEKNRLYTRAGLEIYFKDREERLFVYIRKQVREEIARFITRLRELVKQTDIDCDSFEISAFQSVEEKLVNPKRYDLYPPKQGIFTLEPNISLSTVYQICESIQAEINGVFNNYVNKCINMINERISEKRDARFRFYRAQKYIRTIKIENYGYQQRIKDLQDRLEAIAEKKKQDQATLEIYLKYAEDAYLEQRESIIQKINESTSRDDKMKRILLLGLLDKDYHKVMGGVDEDEY